MLSDIKKRKGNLTKINRFFVGISIVLNIILLVVVLSVTSRINKLEENIKGYEAQINENSVLIEEGLNSMEVNGDIELQQRVRAAEHVISRLEDLIQRQEGISMKYGTIKNIEANDIIKLEIKEYDPHKDEYSSELISLELAKDCKAYFYSELG